MLAPVVIATKQVHPQMVRRRCSTLVRLCYGVVSIECLEVCLLCRIEHGALFVTIQHTHPTHDTNHPCTRAVHDTAVTKS